MKFSQRRILLSSVAVAALLSVGTSFSQDAAKGGAGCNCPNPVEVHIVKNSNPTPVASDFNPGFLKNPPAPYNFNGVNYHFGDTISWKVPTKFCQLQKATVSWTVKNIANDKLQNNDSTSVSARGQSVPGMGGPIGPLAKGQSKTFSYTLTPTQFQSGQISISLQDDTAVTEFRVDISGCCITPS